MDRYETAAARAGAAQAARPGEYETATRFADRRSVRGAGALALARKGKFGRAVSLILHSYAGRRGGKLTDLEVRQRHHEIQGLEIASDDAERERRALAENDRLRRRLDELMR